MMSLKYKNLIKKALYEMDEKDAKKIIEHNKETKNKINRRLNKYDNSSFWIKNIDGYNTVFYYINDINLKNDAKRLIFDVLKIEITTNKTEVNINNDDEKETFNVVLDPGTDINDKNFDIRDVISKYFGVTGVNKNSALSLVKGILSNVKLNTAYLSKYVNRKFLSDEDDNEDTKEENFKNKESHIKDFNSKDVDDLLAKEQEKYDKDHPVKDTNFVLDPSHLIGKNSRLSVNQIKSMVQEKVIELEKEYAAKNKDLKYATPEEIALAIVYKSFDTVVSSNPCNPFNITKYDFKNNKDFTLSDEIFNKDLPNLKSKIRESKFNSFDKNSIGGEVLNYVGTNPPEILSPLAFISMNIPESNWSVDKNGISSKKLVNYLFNRNGTNFKEAKISYPLERNRMLYDSFITIQNGDKLRRINISTKGGQTGQGISASITGLFQYLLDDEYQTENYHDMKKYEKFILPSDIATNDDKNYIKQYIDDKINSFISTYCTKLDQNLKENMDEIKILILFGCSSNKNHEYICTKYYNENSVKDYVKSVNSNREFTNFAMKLLDYQKYDFAQVNVKPYFFGETFSYDYYVQYPAKFSGTVDLEKGPSGEVKFHIVGG